MNVLILGTDAKDKGRQLERLTGRLLGAMGYRDIVTNSVGAGGEEIDVRAKFPIADLGGGDSEILICECKALRGPVALPAWMQFLGKVFHESKVREIEVRGCFIALSGVNGNLSGHYESLSRHTKKIKLVTGQELSQLISNHYACASLEEVAAAMQRYTTRRHQEARLAYFNEQVYWVVLFGDDHYTILDRNGEILSVEDPRALREMIGAATSAAKFVNLREEAEARARQLRAEKEVLTQVIVEGGVANLAAAFASNADVTLPDVESAARRLEARGWVSFDTDGRARLLLDSNKAAEFGPAVHLLTFLLNEYLLTRALGCPTYDSLVDEGLVADIQRLQGNLPLSAEDVGQAIRLLRWSPSALAWALKPDPMIVVHRTTQPFTISEDVNRFGRNYFFASLYRALMRDFGSPDLNSYFLERRSLCELETILRLTLKNDRGVVVEHEIHERRGKAPAAGGGIASVLLLESAPQPWELRRGEKTE